MALNASHRTLVGSTSVLFSIDAPPMATSIDFSLGECLDEDWLGMAKPEILARMTSYEEDQIEFSILGLVKDPMIELVANLAQNVKELQVIKERLDAVTSPSEKPAAPMDGTLLGPDGGFKLTQDDIDKAEVSSGKMGRYAAGSIDELRSLEVQLIDKQKELRGFVKEEQQSQDEDEEHAAGRKHDYAAAVHHWVGLLARKRKIEEFVNKLS